MSPGKSAVLICVWMPEGPIVRREAYAPEARIGICEFERRIEFSGIRACDQLDPAFDFLARLHVQQCDDLALFQRGGHFHESAMRIYDNRASFFAEGRVIGQSPFHDHANLKKQALAASSV
jgi:hypothetical protein